MAKKSAPATPSNDQFIEEVLVELVAQHPLLPWRELISEIKEEPRTAEQLFAAIQDNHANSLENLDITVQYVKIMLRNFLTYGLIAHNAKTQAVIKVVPEQVYAALDYLQKSAAAKAALDHLNSFPLAIETNAG